MNRRFGGSGVMRIPLTSRQRLVYLGGGIVTFAVATLLVAIAYTYKEADAFEKIAPPEEIMPQSAFGSVVLLAPKVKVTQGTKLSHAELMELYWPRNEVPEGAIRRQEDIQEMYAKADLLPGQPILRGSLSSAPILGGLADLIPPNHRATTIEVDATSGVEGWATPGAHVDILVTYHDTADGQKKTQIAVEDAVVLSFNGNTRRDPGSDSSSRMTDKATVTLAVPVLEAVKIHTAVAMGRISLILRSPSDARGVSNLTVSAGDFRTEKPQKKAVEDANGYVSFKDEDGNAHQLELKNNRWFKAGPGDDDS